jgi:DUF4097 and DUF4098 domain-containing protein YvlB
MRRIVFALSAAAVVFCIAVLVCARPIQAGEGSQVTVKLTDPSKPCHVECALINGGIKVTGYSGKEVIVETVSSRRAGWPVWRDEDRRSRRDWDEEDRKEASEGLRKIPVSSSAFEVEEDDNRIVVSVQSWHSPVDVSMKVPVRTSLDLQCVNDGNIEVENVTGEVEAENINGSIVLKGISGSLVAYVQNGNLVAELKSVTRGQPMSFASFNGDVDVTLPADVKTTVKISTHTGDAYSDFDIGVVDKPVQVLEENKEDTDGRYRVRIFDAFYGSINGGGPEFDFSTFNGDIYIRKGK